MIPVSYARIMTRKEKMGIHLVNEKRHDFFIYDRQFISMVQNPGKYRRVKHRNSQSKEAIGYPAGEVWGRYESCDAGNHAKISILIGPNGEDIKLSDSKEPVNVRQLTFILPAEDFKRFYEMMLLMERQKDAFFDCLHGAEMEVDLD